MGRTVATGALVKGTCHNTTWGGGYRWGPPRAPPGGYYVIYRLDLLGQGTSLPQWGLGSKYDVIRPPQPPRGGKTPKSARGAHIIIWAPGGVVTPGVSRPPPSGQVPRRVRHVLTWQDQACQVSNPPPRGRISRPLGERPWPSTPTPTPEPSASPRPGSRPPQPPQDPTGPSGPAVDPASPPVVGALPPH